MSEITGQDEARRALAEDPAERMEFDRTTARLFNGRPMARVAAGLTMVARMQPESGSFGKMLAVWANECAKADTALAQQAKGEGEGGGADG